MDNSKALSFDMGPQVQQDEEMLFTPYDVLSMLMRRFYWILVTTTIIFGVAVLVAKRWPDEFRAETLILVDPQKVPERYVNTTVSMDVGGRLSTINQQLMSSTRLQRIIDTYDLYKPLKNRRTQEEIIEQMRGDVKVEIVRNFDGGGRQLGAFRIAYTGREPPIVAQVCNQLASMFIEENLKVRELQAEGTSEFIDTRLDLAKKTLEENETRLRDFKIKNMGQLPEQAGSNIAQLGGYEQQLRSVSETLNHLRQQETFITSQMQAYQQVQDAAKASLATSTTGPATLNDAALGMTGGGVPISETLARLKSQKTAAEQAYEQNSLKYLPTHPDQKKSKAQIESLGKQIEAEEKRLAALPPAPMMSAPMPAPGKNGEPATDPKDPLAGARQTLKAIQTEVQSRLKEQEQLNGQIRIIQERLESMPMREQEMAETDRDVQLLRSNYGSLLEKKMSADMASDLEKRQKSERFTILDPARIPEKPYGPKRGQILGGAFGAGVGLGLAIIFLLEFRDKSVKKEEEMTRLGLRILGRIPMVVTTEEAQMTMRRRVRNWALGTVATLSVLGACCAVAMVLTRSYFLLP